MQSHLASCSPRACRWSVLAICLVAGCQWFVDDADREVYRLIDQGQQHTLGETRDVDLGREQSPIHVDKTVYDFAPHPVDPNIPPSFTKPATTQPCASAPTKVSEGDIPPVTPLQVSPVPAGSLEESRVQTSSGPPSRAVPSATQPTGIEAGAEALGLVDALAYAFRHSREFQTAKEDLYLAGLALSLERFLWTPQWMGEVRSQYANFGEIRKFDHAMDAVAEVGVQQRLPYGGNLTARTINTLMRDLTNHVTTGESGAVILQADIPLLRGAGRVAYESRYQAERDLIYAIRTFERFRRSLVVDIASDYFELQALKQQILNTQESVDAFAQLVTRAEALWSSGRIIRLEVQRAEQDYFSASNQLIDAIEAYQSALDRFKIRIGMPIEKPIEVTLASVPTTQPQTGRGLLQAKTLEQTLMMPDVSPQEAIKVALQYRLDLLNDLDRIDDSARGVKIAENNLLPDLAAFGSVQFDTNPTERKMSNYNYKRTTWRAGLALELPLNRRAERNDLREAIILKRRAERNYELAQDTVEVQVRRAMRRVQQQQETLRIQMLNRTLAQKRLVAAEIRFKKGQVSNREVVEAQRELLRAQDRLAQSQSGVRTAILEFRRDTGTLRVNDEGQWASLLASARPQP